MRCLSSLESVAPSLLLATEEREFGQIYGLHVETKHCKPDVTGSDGKVTLHCADMGKTRIAKQLALNHKVASRDAKKTFFSQKNAFSVVLLFKKTNAFFWQKNG